VSWEHVPVVSSQNSPPSPRGRARPRDLIGALAVLLVIVGVLVGVGRGCSFSPGGPSVDSGAAPTVDASAALSVAASSVDFPIRRPSLPADWRANSSSTSAVGRGASVIVRVGWLTPSGRFIQLSQSAGAVTDVVAAETDRSEATASGEVDVSGVHWTIYPGRRAEKAWVARFEGVTTLITGTAPEPEFRTLAQTIGSAIPITR
jgi:hypothetical protein